MDGPYSLEIVMYLKRKELEACGIMIKVDDDVIILEAENPWPHAAIDAMKMLTDALGLSDYDSDDVSQYVANITVLRAIKNCAH